MRQLMLSFLVLSAVVRADTLTLEFAQEGEPEIPRAVILIHNAFENRQDMSAVLKRWGSRSWARDQYCSLYSYEYSKNGLYDLADPELQAKDLYSRIRSGNFKKTESDSANPLKRTEPTDERQPQPTTRGETQLLFVGSGYGGLVAREAARLAVLDGREVVKVVYLGSPLDGLSTVELILGFTVQERAQALGLSQSISLADLARLSPAWWHLTELTDPYSDWGSYFARVHEEALGVAAYGTESLPAHPTENVLYGRRRRLANDDRAGDGFCPQPSVWAKNTGPIPWAKEDVLQGVAHAEMTEKSAEFLVENAVETEMTHGYLVRRQVIEQMIRGADDGEIPPIGVYWDERVPGWQNAYASRKGLYELMWLASP